MIRNATLPDGSRHDIEIRDGRIAALRPPTESEPGLLLLPPLVDGHIHLDKTLLGLPWVPNQATGNRVADRIEAERRRLQSEIGRARGKLSNKGFTDKAPAQLVQSERDKLERFEAELAELEG